MKFPIETDGLCRAAHTLAEPDRLFTLWRAESRSKPVTCQIISRPCPPYMETHPKVASPQPPGDSATDGPLMGRGDVAADTAGLDPQRMELLAQISGGIAPALSDLLTVIRGRTEVLLDATEHKAGIHDALEQIYAAAEKACGLMRQLLIFSRQQSPHPVWLDLNGLINETAGVLHRLLGRKIAVEFQLTSGLPFILADPAMLEQVLLILTSNARDAMPEGGSLRFTTGVVEIPEDTVKNRPGEKPGNYVVLQVEDTGGGLSADDLPRIFEPFFTTKVGGRSIGIGLATVFGIAQQHHGWVTAENGASTGSKFKVFLRLDQSASRDAIANGPPPGTYPGHETILLVDDEAAVREVTAMILQEQGYRVLQAGSGPDAMEAWKWHAPRIRLLVTDMVLDDHMNGLQLADRLRAENPALKVICTSGHQRTTIRRFSELSGAYEFIQKPCRPKALLRVVRRLLDEIPS